MWMHPLKDVDPELGPQLQIFLENCGKDIVNWPCVICIQLDFADILPHVSSNPTCQYTCRSIKFQNMELEAKPHTHRQKQQKKTHKVSIITSLAPALLNLANVPSAGWRRWRWSGGSQRSTKEAGGKGGGGARASGEDVERLPFSQPAVLGIKNKQLWMVGALCRCQTSIILALPAILALQGGGSYLHIHLWTGPWEGRGSSSI